MRRARFLCLFQFYYLHFLTRQYWTLFWTLFEYYLPCLFMYVLLRVFFIFVCACNIIFRVFCIVLYACMLLHVIASCCMAWFFVQSTHHMTLAWRQFGHATKATPNLSRRFYMTSFFWEWGLAGQLCHERSCRAFWHASSCSRQTKPGGWRARSYRSSCSSTPSY
jgi:hypothetical protein